MRKAISGTKTVASVKLGSKGSLHVNGKITKEVLHELAEKSGGKLIRKTSKAASKALRPIFILPDVYNAGSGFSKGFSKGFKKGVESSITN